MTSASDEPITSSRYFCACVFRYDVIAVITAITPDICIYTWGQYTWRQGKKRPAVQTITARKGTGSNATSSKFYAY